MSLSLNMDFQFTTSVDKLWSALTDSSKLAKWIAENDFKPIIGHRFQFRHQPNEYWDGIVDSEVLIVDEPTLLSFTWAVGEEKHTVSLTIQDLGDGKVNLHLEQTGITNEQGLAGAKYGWMAWIDKLEKVLEP
ncbi:SRPBCC family protein [Paenibacillus apis]|uniref:Activator of HSP90 ATPase n=1 Tax=Paenibacillus apis TaxID=1792174 RepID=A0A919Y3S2_9BACL|nr:SRPBCC family protein [Paenibacillus apis]GIO44376.1 activator of HSP90 ATPase [Paenibacillus apis]